MRPEVEHALEALKTGDIEHGLKLLERTVLSFGMKVCGHREDAEDTAQEVLLKLLPYVSKFENPKAFSVWLYTVARNRCLMSRRRSKFAPKEELTLDELMPSDQELAALANRLPSTPEHSLLQKENSERVREALERVPTQYRLILVLHDMEGLDTEEVAKIVELRPGTVRVRLHRGRLALRKVLATGEPGKPQQKKLNSKKPRDCREMFAALSDYLDKSIDPTLCERLEKHITGCSPCVAFLADLERTIQLCRSYDPPCDAASKKEVRNRVLAEYSRLLDSVPKISS